MKRLPYPLGLMLMARRCDIDAPRTPYAAARELESQPIERREVRGRIYVLRGEQACIARNARSWSLS
jgi:hypothetical protein